MSVLSRRSTAGPGRDRNAVLVTGQTRTDLVPHLRRPGSRRVTVVGGGLAGVAAAVVLAERGVKVTLHEAEPTLGGRLSSWPDRLSPHAGGDEIQMERGFHAFFRQYYNVRALLRRIDPGLHSLRPVVDYPLFGPGGASESFASLPSRPPLNLAALVRRTPTLGWRDLRAMDGKVASEMLAYDGDATYARFDAISASEYLDRVGFPADARRMLFEVFAHSFFNPEDELSAGELLMMFHLYFLGTSEGILFDVLDEPFGDAVWTPMQRLLDRLRVEVRLQSRVGTLEPIGAGSDSTPGAGVGAAGPGPGGSSADRPVDGLVLAVDAGGLAKVVAANPWIGAGDETWRAGVVGLRSAPPFAVWRLWLDRPVAASRAAFAGTAGLGLIDNVSVLERYQGEARRWSLRRGGSVVEVHAYALPSGRSDEDVRVELLARLYELYPETQRAQILDDRYLCRQDCPAFPPGSFASRPGVATPTPGVVLAGDLVRLPFPTALMERAVTSGFLAANELLSSWGVAPEPVWSVPHKGVLARARSWAAHRSSP